MHFRFHPVLWWWWLAILYYYCREYFDGDDGVVPVVCAGLAIHYGQYRNRLLERETVSLLWWYSIHRPYLEYHLLLIHQYHQYQYSHHNIHHRHLRRHNREELTAILYSYNDGEIGILEHSSVCHDQEYDNNTAVDDVKGEVQ